MMAVEGWAVGAGGASAQDNLDIWHGDCNLQRTAGLEKYALTFNTL